MTLIFSARLFARSLLLGCFVLLSTGSGASGNPPFANVTRLKGEVTATSPQGETRQLRAGQSGWTRLQARVVPRSLVWRAD